MLPLRELFDDRVALRIEPIGEPNIDRLPAEERALVAKAVPKRIREFCAGRTLARRMLADVGRPVASILRGPNGAPSWPPGVRGSITHAGAWVGVAISTSPEVLGVGLDIEDGSPLHSKYWHVIMTEEDMSHLDAVGASDRERIAKVMFSAKEAAYKAQHAITETFLAFSAMDIRIAANERSFVATFHQSVSPFAVGDEIEGSIARFDGNVATAVTLDTR